MKSTVFLPKKQDKHTFRERGGWEKSCNMTFGKARRRIKGNWFDQFVV